MKNAPEIRLLSASTLAHVLAKSTQSMYVLTACQSFPQPVAVRSRVGRPARLYSERDVLAWLDRERPDLAKKYRTSTASDARRVGGAA